MSDRAASPRRILTPNRMGWASTTLTLAARQFAGYCRAAPTPPVVLEIGAGLGAAAFAAFDAGAIVIANDIDLSPLEAHASDRLVLRPGSFPRELHFDLESLDAIHASNVLHFLNGRRLEHGFRSIARWLRPGGRLFLQASTPFQAPFAAFLPEYQRRLGEGARWPGWIAKVSAYSKHRKLGQMPTAVHLLDDHVLARTARDSGLSVETATLFRDPALSPSLHLDGRESVLLLASKPPL